MDFTQLVGNVAVVFTIAANFAGLPVCLDILRRKSTSGVSSLPFLFGAVNSWLWLQYGNVIGDLVVQMVNLIGIVLQCTYLACYYYATADKASIIQCLLWAIGFLLAIYGYTFHIAMKQSAIQALGLLASGGSIVTCTSPLVAVKEVFRSRSTENFPFPIIFCSFFVTTLWCTYGVLVDDSFIMVPNLIGAVICGIQLSLFVIFDSKSPETKVD